MTALELAPRVLATVRRVRAARKHAKGGMKGRRRRKALKETALILDVLERVMALEAPSTSAAWDIVARCVAVDAAVERFLDVEAKRRPLRKLKRRLETQRRLIERHLDHAPAGNQPS